MALLECLDQGDRTLIIAEVRWTWQWEGWWRSVQMAPNSPWARLELLARQELMKA